MIGFQWFFFLQDDVPPEVHIRIGQELLVLDSWCKKKQYDTICSVLGSGMNYHLAENRLLRDIFTLGDKVSMLTSAQLKQSKYERVSSLQIVLTENRIMFSCLQNLANAAAFKHRTITRGKNRDKRSAVIPF